MPVRKPDNVQVHRIELGKKERKWVEDFLVPATSLKMAGDGVYKLAIGGSYVLVSYAVWWAVVEYFQLAARLKGAFGDWVKAGWLGLDPEFDNMPSQQQVDELEDLAKREGLLASLPMPIQTIWRLFT